MNNELGIRILKLVIGSIILYSLFLILYSVPVLAQTSPTYQTPTPYTLLAPIPLKDPKAGVTETTTAIDYIPGVIKLTIALAGVLAVVRIVFGGFQYISTDAITGKSSAKSTIQNAVWGLILALTAWLILYTINPKLVSIDLSISRVGTTTPISGIGGGSAGPAGLTLTDVQARTQLNAVGVKTDPLMLLLSGLRQSTVDEAIRLKQSCGCDITITSATSGSHASGDLSHANGYKIDVRLNSELTNHITSHYTKLPDRSDGAKMYRAPSGALYALESNHWDIVVPGS